MSSELERNISSGKSYKWSSNTDNFNTISSNSTTTESSSNWGSSSGWSSELEILQKNLKIQELENKRLTESLLQNEPVYTVPVQLSLDRSIVRYHHDTLIVDDKNAVYNFVGAVLFQILSLTILIIMNMNIWTTKSLPPSNLNPVYMNEATNLYPFESGNPNTDESCEVDRGINRSKNRSHCNDAYSNADYERCVVSSSDDTSNKRKVVAETDVSRISLIQTRRSSEQIKNN